MASMRDRFIPASHHPFFVFPPTKKKKHFEDCRRARQKEEKWSREKLQFEIHMAQINFMASCIAVDPVRARQEAKKTHFLYSVSFHCWWSGTKKQIYAIFKILFILKCASNVAHFFSF